MATMSIADIEETLQEAAPYFRRFFAGRKPYDRLVRLDRKERFARKEAPGRYDPIRMLAEAISSTGLARYIIMDRLRSGKQVGGIMLEIFLPEGIRAYHIDAPFSFESDTDEGLFEIGYSPVHPMIGWSQGRKDDIEEHVDEKELESVEILYVIERGFSDDADEILTGDQLDEVRSNWEEAATDHWHAR